MRRSAAAVLLVAAVLTACGDARSNDAAAEVDGTEVSRTDYEDLLQYLTNETDITGVQEDPATGTVPGDTGRQVLAVMVRDTASREFLAGSGESITDADRQTVLDTIAQDDPARALRPDVFDLLVDQQAGAAARGADPGAGGRRAASGATASRRPGRA